MHDLEEQSSQLHISVWLRQQCEICAIK